MIGPGKYDDLATKARISAAAEGVILIVYNGDKGSGFSAKLPGYMISRVPAVLRELANNIEENQRLKMSGAQQ